MTVCNIALIWSSLMTVILKPYLSDNSNNLDRAQE